MSAHEVETLIAGILFAAGYLVTCYALPFAIVERGER